MDHKEWAKRMTACLSTGADLEKLLEDTQAAEDGGVGAWHVGQVLTAIWERESDRGTAESASSAARACIEHARGWHRSWSQTLADGLLLAALEEYAADRPIEGEAFLQDALREVGSRVAYADSTVLSEVMRHHLESRRAGGQ